jgi:hypothetical protein
MFGAGMPEAAVDEHHDARARKRDINPTSRLRADTDVDAETQAPTKELAAHCEFGLGVASPIGPHRGSRGRG